MVNACRVCRSMESIIRSPSKRYHCLLTTIILGCLLISAAIIFAVVWVTEHNDDDDCPSPVTSPSKASYKSGTGSYKYAAVASEDEECSQIGNDILARMRGNAVDATVATLICNGVKHSQSSGIGGGAFFVIYNKKEGGFYAVNARETAPAGATQGMFQKEEDRNKAKVGGLAIAVPGELKGLYEVHKRFGFTPWKTLMEPTVNLLRNGYTLNAAVQERVVKLKNRTGFEIFLDDNGDPLPVGSIIKDPKLLQTFETLADNPNSFYNGSLAEDIAKDIEDAGGIVTAEDLHNYTVAWKDTTVIKLPGNLTLYSMPPPGSGVVLNYILSILSGYNFNADSVATDGARILTYHRIVEAMKFAYGKRSSLGDEDFVDVVELVKNMTSREFGEETRQKINDAKTMPFDYYESDFYNQEDHGTNHLSVVDGEGNAVAVTSTVNLYFGSKVVGKRTGILFNDIMDDFSTPGLINAFGFSPSASNFIVPGKRPQSSMSPSIVIDDKTGRVRMTAGAAGGSRITSTTAVLLMDVLWFGMTMGEAMDQPRIHHQLLPNNILVEPQFSTAVRAGLEAKGHVIKERKVMSVAHAIDVNANSIDAASDFRKGGKPDGY